MQVSRRLFIKIGIILASIAIGWWVGRSIFINLLYAKIEEQLYNLRDSGYIVDYDSIKIDWTENTIEVYKLSVKRDLDSIRCATDNFLSSQYIKAEGFSVTDLVLHRELNFTAIRLDSPKLIIYEDFLEKDTVDRERKDFSLDIGKLIMPHLIFEHSGRQRCDLLARYTGNVSAEDVELTITPDQPAVLSFDKISSDSIRLVQTRDQYTYTIKQFQIDIKNERLTVDTIRVIPHFKKYEFANRLGYQTDRFEGVIPYINLYGFKLYAYDSLGFEARKMTAQIFLHAFRDKRIPFKATYKPLPMEQLAKMDVGIKIDSIILNKSRIVYEEFGEEADSAGYLSVDNLYAMLRNVDNTNPLSTGKTSLTAESAFMGKGLAKIRATFPHDYKARHSVTGSISSVPMTSFNPMIEPALNVRAESGFLEQIDFHFTADNYSSHGEIQLNYNNLRLTTFKKPSTKKKKGLFRKIKTDEIKNGFKTFIVNTFIIKKNMDESVPEEKRKGEISFERNRSKYIFNFWWKSVASGIKSAYKIDKLEESKVIDVLTKDDK